MLEDGQPGTAHQLRGELKQYLLKQRVPERITEHIAERIANGARRRLLSLLWSHVPSAALSCTPPPVLCSAGTQARRAASPCRLGHHTCTPRRIGP